ncbi:MAG: lysine exporter LysO family protein [Firmicutes bacterium]|nr:lysine exporter LysO family protein [Bacillota bacterium]
MTSLLLYIAVTVAGYFIGAWFKKNERQIPLAGKMQTAAIIALVFLMGSRIGANEEIVASLGSIGLISLAYTAIIMVITCAAYTAARRLLGFDRRGVRHAGAKAGGSVAEDCPKEEGGPEDEAGAGLNQLTLLIVAFVAVGIACGYFLLPEGFIAVTGDLLTITLCILLVLIGIDIGTEGTLAANFRRAGWRVIVFPFVSMIAMLIASAAAALVLPLGLQDSLCIGSGFAWYSLAPAMLAEYSTRVSAISFMHNVFREIIGILLIPVVARRIGYIECYGMPGSPSMDVCLPVIERATSSDVAVYSFINGAILSAAVPVLVSLFMNL